MEFITSEPSQHVKWNNKQNLLKMKNDIDVSVVMSVYNGAKYLRESIESILSQKEVNFEFIIVNDGSTDESGDIIAEYAARDNRLRVLEQKNMGLTHSLIIGCNLAKGEFIARQDVGDKSLDGRLIKQLDYLKSNKQLSLVSCFSIFKGPYNLELYRIKRKESPEEATNILKKTNITNIQGLSHHGTAMFRRKDYRSVGGYRKHFYFAQDLDLWLRLTDIGLLGFVKEYLYEANIFFSSIGSVHREKQIQLANLAIELSRLREKDLNESLLLKKASMIRPSPKQTHYLERIKFFYFFLSCILKRINLCEIRILISKLLNNNALGRTHFKE